MNAGEALDRIATLKSKLTRYNEMRSRLFDLKKDTEIDYDYKTITENIDEIHDEIINLKVRIQRSNIAQEIEIPDGDGTKTISKAEAILLMGKLGSELSQLQQNKIRYSGESRSYLSSDSDVEYHQPMTELEREELIDKLESQKKAISMILQADNWKTEV